MVATDTGALRSELIGALPGAYPWHEVVDQLLALPALRDLIAERDDLAAKVEQVRELADGWTASGQLHDDAAAAARGRFDLASELVHGLTGTDLTEHADAIRRVLDGER